MGETKAVSDGLLSARISELALSITGTRLEPLINQVYRELDGKGISFKPATYLSDEWGCPSGVPVIGIPFYLADPALCALEDEMTGIEAETDAEVPVPPPRGGTCFQLCIPAVREEVVEGYLRPVLAAIQRRI